MAPRGRGGKFSKPSRGGGKHFSRDLQPLDKDGNPLGMWRDSKDKVESSSSEEEESSEEESSEEEDPSSSTAAAGSGEVSREQRKEIARKKKQAAIAKKNKKVAEVGDMPTDSEESSSEEEEEDEGDLPANPNHTSKARNQARAVTGASGETPLPSRKEKENLSRREREAIAAQAAKERYQKLHAEGKTDEAKADLARLKLIKEQREAAAARKEAEKEERDERERTNKEKLDKEAAKRADALGNAGADKKKVVKGKK